MGPSRSILEPASLTLTPVADQPKKLSVALDRALHVEAAPGRLAIQDLAAHVGAATVTGSGALDANDPHSQLNVRVDGAAKDLTDVASAVGFDKVVATAGQMSVAVSASGAPTAPRVTATANVDAGTLQVGSTAVTGVRARASLTPEGLNIEQASAQWGDITATASGRAPLKWLHGVLPWLAEGSTAPAAAPATLTAHVAGDLGKLLAARMPRGTTTSGSLDATLELSATSPRIDAVTGSLSVAQASVASGSSKIEQASEGRMRIAHGRAELDPWTLKGPRSNLVISGSMAFAGDQPTLDLRLAGPLGLPPLQPLLGMPIAGTIVSDLVVRGPATAPRVDGTVHLDNAALRVAIPRLSFANVSGDILFTEGRAVVDDVTGEANGAPILIRGTYDLSGAATPTLSFTAVGVPIQVVVGRSTRGSGRRRPVRGRERQAGDHGQRFVPSATVSGIDPGVAECHYAAATGIRHTDDGRRRWGRRRRTTKRTASADHTGRARYRRQIERHAESRYERRSRRAQRGFTAAGHARRAHPDGNGGAR